jgi:hypothetical protein
MGRKAQDDAMTALNSTGLKRARKRNLTKISPLFLYAGLVTVSLGIIGTLSVLSLSA